MELLKTARRRSLFSEIVYIVLNILLALGIFSIVVVTASPWYALALVLLSKWRVFAVRTRYWMANIRANLIDTIVGSSVVVFLYAATGSLAAQVGLTALYIVWLLFIKPRSRRAFIVAQAWVGLAFGIGALMQLSAGWLASLVVLLAWVVGYSAARHVLSVEHETHLNFLSLVWGFVVAEIAWLTYHWTIGYNMPGAIQLAQATIIIVILSFLAERVHASYQRDGKVQVQELVLPTLLSLSIIGVLLFVFGGAISI
jgi:hypothetical protein